MMCVTRCNMFSIYSLCHFFCLILLSLPNQLTSLFLKEFVWDVADIMSSGINNKNKNSMVFKKRLVRKLTE